MKEIKEIIKELKEGGDEILFLREHPNYTKCECCASENLRRVKFIEREEFPEGWFNCYICKDCDFSGVVNIMNMFDFTDTTKIIKDFELKNNIKIRAFEEAEEIIDKKVNELKKYTENLGFEEIRDGDLHFTLIDDKIDEIFGDEIKGETK